MDLGTLGACASAVAAFVALGISCYQIRLSNKQSLFSRRLKLWLIVGRLMEVYRGSAGCLKQDDEPQFDIGACFVWLTNDGFLQEITSCINHRLENDYQLKLHLKLEEMASLATEASFVFRGKTGMAISSFLNAYKELLLEVYRYQILLSHMQDCSKQSHLDLEKAANAVNEKGYRIGLYAAEDALQSAYEILSGDKMLHEIEGQISLVCIWPRRACKR